MEEDQIISNRDDVHNFSPPNVVAEIEDSSDNMEAGYSDDNNAAENLYIYYKWGAPAYNAVSNASS